MTRHAEKTPDSRVLSCRHFGLCGGCSALDVPISQQVAAKRDEVAAIVDDVLRARSQPPVQVVVDTPERTPIGSRAKLLYPAQPDPKGGVRLGLYERRSHRLVQIRECKTQMMALTDVGQRVETVLRDLDLAAYDEQNDTGFVRAVQARIAPGTGELLIGIITRAGTFDAAAECAEAIYEACEDLPRSGRHPTKLIGVMRSIGSKTGNFLLGERHMPLRGRDYLIDRQGGLQWKISFSSFYQVHKNADAVLYRPALELAGDLRGKRVVDGYGGIGTFGLRCARAGAAEVQVIEEHGRACSDARDNVKKNKLKNATVIESPFASADFAPEPDLLIVDPTRKGLGEEGVARIVAARPKQLLHVACSLVALRRDLDALLASGMFKLTTVRACDLFPHAPHAEVIAAYERT